MHATRRSPEPPPPHTDGIVALTGGAGRVELALHLLATGRADRLLLSGIGGGTDLATLGRLAGIDTASLVEPDHRGALCRLDPRQRHRNRRLGRAKSY